MRAQPVTSRSFRAQVSHTRLGRSRKITLKKLRYNCSSSGNLSFLPLAARQGEASWGGAQPFFGMGGGAGPAARRNKVLHRVSNGSRAKKRGANSTRCARYTS